jgi:hypothetical protein
VIVVYQADLLVPTRSQVAFEMTVPRMAVICVYVYSIKTGVHWNANYFAKMRFLEN